MLSFSDTSLLCALYNRRETALIADDVLRDPRRRPIRTSAFVAFEFRQSVRLQVLRFSSERTVGFAPSEAMHMLADFEDDIENGVVRLLSFDAAQALALAEELSVAYTARKGHRTMDVFHVATACLVGADEFLTFDRNQALLAEARGLKVQP